MNDSPANQSKLFDAYAPPQIAERVENAGVAKAGLPAL